MLLIALLVSACSLPLPLGVPRVQGATPEEVTQRYVPHLGRPAPAHVQIHGTRTVPQGVVVLYTADMPAQDGPPNPPNMGYVFTTQRRGSWQATRSTYGSSFVAPGQLLDYRSGAFAGGANTAVIVYGRVLSPEVTAVEATFDTGQVVRDQVTGAMFSLIAPDATAACELRALDTHGNVVEQFAPAHADVAPHDAQARAASCPAT